VIGNSRDTAFESIESCQRRPASDADLEEPDFLGVLMVPSGVRGGTPRWAATSFPTDP
jgi:hypothetical protein